MCTYQKDYNMYLPSEFCVTLNRDVLFNSIIHHFVNAKKQTNKKRKIYFFFFFLRTMQHFTVYINRNIFNIVKILLVSLLNVYLKNTEIILKIYYRLFHDNIYNIYITFIFTYIFIIV